jgi:hypothetical protein
VVVTQPDPEFVAGSRRRDLLQTCVLLGLLFTPAWLTPPWFARPWLLVTALLGLPAVWWSWRHAPWVPTPTAERARLLAALALQPHETFCDLGAGDGRVVAMVSAATEATCWGVEVSPLLWLLGSLRLLWQGRGARLRLGDLYKTDLSGVDAVYVWGTAYSAGTERFVAFLRSAMRPGTRVISYHTELPGLEAERVDHGGQRPLWTYRIP